MSGLKCPDCHWAMGWTHKPGHAWCAIKGSDCWVPDSTDAPDWCPTTRAVAKATVQSTWAANLKARKDIEDAGKVRLGGYAPSLPPR